MEKKLFESKGIPKSHASMLVFCGVVLMLIGVVVLFLYGTAKDNFLYSLVYRKEAKWILILGIVLFAYGCGTIINLIMRQKSVFTVYENHIESIQYIPVFIICIKNEFNIEYDQIIEVQITKAMGMSNLKIVTQGGKYNASIKGNGDKVCNFIKQKMKISRNK